MDYLEYLRFEYAVRDSLKEGKFKCKWEYNGCERIDYPLSTGLLTRVYNL